MSGSDYLKMFVEEAAENLQTLNRALLELEDDPKSGRILDEIFRAAHSLKGMAATMDFSSMARLTHKLEDVLELCRSESLAVTPELIDQLFKALDLLEDMVQNIVEEGEEGALETDLISELEALVSGDGGQNDQQGAGVESGWEDLDESEKKVLKKARDEGYNLYVLRVRISPEAPLKGARAFMVCREVEVEGQVVKSIPSEQKLEDGDFDDQFWLLAADARPRSRLKEEIQSIADLEEVEVTPLEVGDQPENQKEEQRKDTARTETPGNRIQTGQILRVDIEKMDNLMNLVGELVISRTLLKGIGERAAVKEMDPVLDQIDRITNELQSTVMEARMVSVGRIFNRFPRMVRDLSRELGKEINFTMEGVDTELDRTIIDELGDPLVHLLRNAIDHGIESPKEREKKGKSREGRISLSARHQGNSVVIKVSDDGRGLDREKIIEKALTQDFIEEHELEEMDEWEIYSLIFAPGFSMADKITDLSGRGVGMDAVNKKIETLGGVIDVSSRKDEGTEFSIQLPLTIAIIQALLIDVAGEVYAVPLSNIEEVLEVENGELHRVQNQDVISLRGDLISLVDMAEFMGFGRRAREGKELPVVVVESGKKKAGLVVDKLLRQQEIVIKTLSEFFSDLDYLSGATILGDGDLALILDVRRIF